MNRSIYLMVTVPYVALGVVGFMIYRGVRKNDEHKVDMETKSTADERRCTQMDGTKNSV